MPREGTRSQTGHAAPRIFHQVDTAPTIKRTTKPKKAAVPKSSKPVGVTKKTKAGPKKESTVAKKVKAVGTKVKKAAKAVEKKTVAKTKAAPKSKAAKKEDAPKKE